MTSTNSNKQYNKQTAADDNSSTTGNELGMTGGVNGLGDDMDYNSMGVAYNLSQQFYETMYKDKLKECDKEKKKRVELEGKVEELEESLKLLIEDSENTREELKTCITDNSLLAQNI